MNNFNDLAKVLNPIFQEIFNDFNINITPEMSSSSFEQWDSLNNIRLMVQIEKVLKISFETTQLTSIRNVGELVEIINGKLSK
jgi:acyl carrier protein